MSQFRFARLAMMLAALGLNAAPALMHSASAQDKQDKNAPAAAPKPDSVRPDLFKLLDPAQIKPLMEAKNYTEVQNRITQAEAFPDKTPYETYVLNRMKLSLGSSTGNDQMATSALEAILASGKLPEADKANFTQALATMYYNAKNYPKAIELYKQIQASGKATDQVNSALIRSYYLRGDYATALKAQEPVLQAAEQAGKTPSQEDLRLYASAANKVKDDAAYLRGLEKLVAYYPNDDFWTDMISRGIVRKPGFQDANIPDVLRLQFAAVKQMSSDSYVELAELAMKDGFPTEAKKVVDAGFAAGVLGTGSGAAKDRQLRDRATKEAASDAKNIAAGEAGAAKAKTGAGLVNLGWAYVTMDQYDKGIGFIQQGIAKGSLKSPDEAKLRLGMAYAKAGQKDKAIATFQEVKAGGGLSDTAKYWILLLNHPTGATAAK
jgi:tetratricopeptide (TPR) repeat protein